MIKKIMFAILTLVVVSSCSDFYGYQEELNEPAPDPTTKPFYYHFTTGDEFDVLDKDGNLHEANVPLLDNGDRPSIETEEKKVHGGKHSLNLIDSFITINSDGEYPVKYRIEGVEQFYNVTVKGCTIKYTDASSKKTYNLLPYKDLKVSIREHSNDIQDDPFLQNFVSANSLIYEDILLDMATQEIEVSEDEAILEEVVLLKSEHLRFIREATITSNPTNNKKTLVAKGINQVTFEEYWSNDSTATAVVEYNLEYHFNISAPTEVVVDAIEIVGKTFEVKNGKVSISGYDFEFTFANTNCATVEYKGTDYTDKVLKCNPEVKAVKVIDANNLEIYVYENNEDDYSKATMPLAITEPEAELEKTEWNYEHTRFVRNASVTGLDINVPCDNAANFTDFYNDGSERNKETITYRVNNTFKVSGLSFEVANLSNVIGRTYNIVNGVVTIEGNNVVISHISSAVVGNVMHNNINYADKIIPCKAEAKNITFTSQSEAVIRFYDNNANDYSEAIVSTTITEKVTVTAIEKTFKHVSFNNAQINGNIISIACDNIASFVKLYSNNTSDPAVEIPYTWNNYFQLSIPEFYTHNMNEKTYYFNAGSADVEGQNVSVTFSSRNVSDIYFDGVNYRNEAPTCSIQPESIYFREGFADITFREGDETVVVTTTVGYRSAETVTGKIVAGWMTDSFTNQHNNYEGTYLHIMAELNGAYVIYSRRNDATTWTTTNLTAQEGSNLLNSGRAAAWVYNGTNYIMGSVTAIAREDVKDRWILEYYLLNGQLAYRLGKNAETIMGGIYRHPVREVAQNSNGIWLINNQVFAGTN